MIWGMIVSGVSNNPLPVSSVGGIPVMNTLFFVLSFSKRSIHFCCSVMALRNVTFSSDKRSVSLFISFDSSVNFSGIESTAVG